MGNWRKILLGVLIIALGVPSAALIALQSPKVQTSLARRATAIISANIDGQVSVGKVSIAFPRLFLLKNVCITGEGPQDTVICLGKAFVDARLFALLGGSLIVDKVWLEDGSVRIRNLNDSTTNLSRMLAPFAGSDTDESEESLLRSLSVRRVALENFDISRKNAFAPTADTLKVNPNVLNTNDLEIENLNLDIRNIKYRDTDDASLSIRKFSFNEKSGFTLRKMEADFLLDKNGLSVSDLYYQDDDSHLQAPRLALLFDDFSAFDDFFNEVAVDVDVKDVHFDGKTLEHLAGVESSLMLDAAFTAEGAMNNLRSDKLRILTTSHKSFLDLSASVSGLPDLKSLLIDVNFKKCQTNASDLAFFLSTLNPAFDRKTISGLAPGETVYFRGTLRGKPDKFEAKGRLSTTSMGEVRLKFLCDNALDSSLGLKGLLQVDKLNLGGILCVPDMGELTCDAALDGVLGGAMSFDIDSMKIASFTYNGYEYRNIRVDGLLTDNKFDGTIFCKDPNIDFTFKGIANFSQDSSSTARYKFNMNVRNVNLHALNFDKREISSIALRSNADIVVGTDGNIRGQASVTDIYTTLAEGKTRLEDIRMRAYMSDERYVVGLSSGFAQIRYRGSSSIGKFIADITEIAGKKNLSHILGEPGSVIPDEYNFSLITGNLRNICGFLSPGLFVADSTRVNLQLSRNGEIKGLVASDLIAYNDNYIKNLHFDASNHDSGALKVSGSIELLQSGDIEIRDNTVDVGIGNNTVSLQYAFDNKGEKQTRARICAAAQLCHRDSVERVVASILPSELVLSGQEWNLSPGSVRVGKESIDIENFKISSGGQYVALQGTVGPQSSDTLLFDVNKFDLSSLAGLLSEDYRMTGILDADGEGHCIGGEEMGVQLGLAAEGLHFNGTEIGTVNLSSEWNQAEKRFDLKLDNILSGRNPLRGSGFYVPSDGTVKFDASFDEFGAGCLSFILSGVASDLTGSISGKMRLGGSFDNFDLQSEGLRFNRVGATLDYTQVPYIFDGPLSLDSRSIRFLDVKISDTYGHSGVFSGTVDHDHFDDIALNLRIRLNNMLSLKTAQKDNESFFGTAFATGTVSVRGPLERINIDIRVKTDEHSSINIPLGGSSGMKTSMLTFINNRAQMSVLDSLKLSYKAKQQEENVSGETLLNVNAQITATPDATVQLVVDPSSGDAVKVKGSGKIGINIDPVLPMDLNGEYVIDEGIYKLSLLGLVSKDFTLNSGSKVSLNGDIMDTDLDLTANYRTKASISTLIADSTSVGNRRYVDCGIKVTGKLENPQINFDIQIPDIDPSTQGKVAAALNTEEKRMQQVLALLVSGSFVPDEQSGIVNNTTILYSNASEIMSNQLNKILQRLDIPVDFGFNYQPTSRGSNLFDVAISTQLFNNRVTINGNIGNRQYMSSSRSDVVGDVDVQIKVNKSGDLRFNLFSHSADEYSNFIDQTQRNGVGIVYQKEFDTWGEFFRKTFWSKSRQEQYEREQMKRHINIR